MAVSLTSEARPASGLLIKTVALAAAAANSTKVTLPVWALTWEVQFLQADGSADSGKIATTGTDAAAIDTNYWQVTSGASYYPPPAPSDARRTAEGVDLYLTASTNSATARFVFRG